MTGYGSGRAGQFTVEAQSVNRRQSEVVINLPRELSALEPAMREAVQARIARGRVVVNVSCQSGGASGQGRAPTLDAAAAKAYYQAMRALQEELGLNGQIGIETVLRAPGVLKSGEEVPDIASAQAPALEALDAALGELLAMRAKEGARLGEDLAARLESLRTHVAGIRRRQPEAIAQYRENLNERLRRAGLDLPIDEERLAREIVLFADRCDISEEVTRLESHLDQFADLLKKDEPVGRTLDFLSQELARELNTLGAKGNDLALSQLSVASKTELDKIREQVQNIE
jgi:uncharacterized protein (TIGR00255 family)